jgi:hypothetical protein
MNLSSAVNFEYYIIQRLRCEILSKGPTATLSGAIEIDN